MLDQETQTSKLAELKVKAEKYRLNLTTDSRSQMRELKRRIKHLDAIERANAWLEACYSGVLRTGCYYRELLNTKPKRK